MKPRSATERYVPLLYLVAALALVALVLPTALRPPQPPPPSSAEFSPDAPPDENSEVILSELARGTSSTAGAGPTEVGGSGPAVPIQQIVKLPPRGKCFGQPSRQVESLYAPPCVPAYVGDNGGATHQGVTKDEIRIGLISGSTGFPEGPVPDEKQVENESDVYRTWRIYQRYFNEHFELYGRRVRFYTVTTSRTGSGSSVNAVTRLADEYKVFGVIATGTTEENESLRKKLVTFGGIQNLGKWFADHSPLAYSFKADGSTLVKLSAELACKYLWGRPVSFTDDPTFNGKPRKYGLPTYDDVTHRGYADEFKQLFEQMCGGKIDMTLFYNGGDLLDDGLQIMTKFKAEGITTIICLCEAIGTAVGTAQATQQGYFPEWMVTGGGSIDTNEGGKLYDKAQSRHMMGLSSLEMARPINELDWYRAYKSVDPEGEPEGENDFYEMLQFVGGIQMAGPTLNPETFRQGLQRKWPRRPPDPVWSIGGGYGPNDWTYPDYVALIWWDETAQDPQSSRPGAYRHILGGNRFTYGEIPTADVLDQQFFKEGMSRPPPPQR